MSDALGNTTTYTYDQLDRVVKEQQSSLADFRSFAYDASGNLTQVKDRLGRYRTFAYDGLDRKTAEHWRTSPTGTPSNEFTWNYNEASELEYVTDTKSGVRYDYSYDFVGRVTKVDNDLSTNPSVPEIWIEYGYDPAGNRNRVSDELGRTTHYDYDGAGRLKEIDNQFAGLPRTDLVKFGYNHASQLETITRHDPINKQNLLTGPTTTYGYDSVARLKDLEHFGAGPDASYNYTYDGADRITQLNSLFAGVTNYRYDAADQLLSSDRSVGLPDELFEFDAAGNRRSHDLHPTEKNNRLADDGTYAYTYDKEGNVTLRSRLDGGEQIQYAWDHRNRLISILSRPTPSQAINKSLNFTYDPLDRRIVTSFDADGVFTVLQPVDERYVYDGDHIRIKYEQVGGAYVPTHEYTHGDAVDQVMADFTAGTVQWPLADHEGSIRALAAIDSRVISETEYDAFGRATLLGDLDGDGRLTTADTNAMNAALNAQSGYQWLTDIDHNGQFNIFDLATLLIRLDEFGGQGDVIEKYDFGFTGREFDVETGLNYYRARYYDPSTGRFLSTDPSGYSGGDMNLYRYVGNDPVNNVDPSGLIRGAAQLGSASGSPGGNRYNGENSDYVNPCRSSSRRMLKCTPSAHR